LLSADPIPGALERHGAGFKAAAMVRLMHSMVRFNLLHRGEHWDVKTYGIPIPQVEQMPVGFVSIFPLAHQALRQGRTTFTPAESAREPAAHSEAAVDCRARNLQADLLQRLAPGENVLLDAVDKHPVQVKEQRRCKRPLLS
jgi:hypothetical protein